MRSQPQIRGSAKEVTAGGKIQKQSANNSGQAPSPPKPPQGSSDIKSMMSIATT